MISILIFIANILRKFALFCIWIMQGRLFQAHKNPSRSAHTVGETEYDATHLFYQMLHCIPTLPDQSVVELVAPQSVQSPQEMYLSHSEPRHSYDLSRLTDAHERVLNYHGILFSYMTLLCGKMSHIWSNQLKVPLLRSRLVWEPLQINIIVLTFLTLLYQTAFYRLPPFYVKSHFI